MRLTEAVTPGVVICLVTGGFIYLLAPIMLALAFALSKRITVAQQAVRFTFLTNLGLLGFIGVLAGLSADLFFSEWWRVVGMWSLFFCWVTLVLVLTVVARALRDAAPPPPYRPWS